MNIIDNLVSEFLTVLAGYPVLISTLALAVIVVVLIWIWSKIPEAKNDQKKPLWELVLAWISQKWKTIKQGGFLAFRQIVHSPSQLYEKPWYLVLKPFNDNTLFSKLPSDELVRTPPRFMHHLLQNDLVKWFFLRRMNLVEVPFDKGAKVLSNKLIEINLRRSQRPIDGLIISIPAEELRNFSEEDLTNLSEDLLTCLHVVDEKVSFLLPVYLIINHCEDVPGFSAFAKLNSQKNQQMFGWSTKLKPGENYHKSLLQTGFDTILESVKRNQIVNAASQSKVPNVDSYLLLDQQISSLKPGVELVCEKLFSEKVYRNGLLFRGVYLVGNTIDDESKSQSSEGIFARELINKKIAAESNLATPTGRGLVHHQKVLKKVKWLSRVGLTVVLIAGVLSLISLKQQMDVVGSALNNLHISAEKSSSGFAQLHSTLQQLSEIDANGFDRIALPISWFINIDKKIIDAISEHQFAGVIYPTLECRLGDKFSLALINNPLREKFTLPNGFDWVYVDAWLQEMVQFTTNQHAFIELSKPSKSDQGNVLKLFSELVYQLYDIKLPNSFFSNSLLYQRALEQLDYPYDVGQKKCTSPLTGVDKVSATEFWKHINAQAKILYQQIQVSAQAPHEKSPAGEYVSLEKWFIYLERMWLLGNSQPNPCQRMRTQIGQMQSQWLNHSPASRQLAQESVALFGKQKCDGYFFQTLTQNSLPSQPTIFSQSAPYSVSLSPSTAAFRNGLGGLDKLSFMQLDTSMLPTKTRKVLSWDAARIANAVSYYKAYESYALTDKNFSSLTVNPKSIGSKAFDLQTSMLNQLRKAMVYELVWAKYGSQETKLATVPTDIEQNLADKVNQFQSLTSSFYLVRDAFSKLGFDSELGAWEKTTRDYALSLLQETDKLIASSLLYQPQSRPIKNSKFLLGSVYGIDTKANLDKYMFKENRRASYIAYNYAQAAVNYLFNTSPELDSSKPPEQLVWKETLLELSKSEQGDESSSLTSLAALFESLLGTTVKACPSNLIVAGGEDIFRLAETDLAARAMFYCNKSNDGIAYQNYLTISDLFNSSLRGNYPFAPLSENSPNEASVFAVNAFFTQFDALSKDILADFKRLAKDHQKYKPAVEFMEQMQRVSEFFDTNIKADNGSGKGKLTLDVVFQVYAGASVSSADITDKLLSTGSGVLKFPSATQRVPWAFGDEIEFSAKVASGSEFTLNNPTTNSAPSYFSFTGAGNWGLLRMIERYRSNDALQTTVANPGDIILEFPISLKEPIFGSNGKPPAISSTTKTVSVPLGISLLGLDAKTKQLVRLKFPDYFPQSIPTIEGHL